MSSPSPNVASRVWWRGDTTAQGARPATARHRLTPSAGASEADVTRGAAVKGFVRSCRRLLGDACPQRRHQGRVQRAPVLAQDLRVTHRHPPCGPPVRFLFGTAQGPGGTASDARPRCSHRGLAPGAPPPKTEMINVETPIPFHATSRSAGQPSGQPLGQPIGQPGATLLPCSQPGFDSRYVAVAVVTRWPHRPVR